MSDEASNRGRDRRTRRREWSDVEDAEFDQRHTRRAKFKMIAVTIRFDPDTLAQFDAARRDMQFGRGMSRGEFVTWLFKTRTKAAQKAWMESDHVDRYDR